MLPTKSSAATALLAVAFLSLIAQVALASNAVNTDAADANGLSSEVDTRTPAPSIDGENAASSGGAQAAGASLEQVTVTGAFLPVVTEIPGGAVVVSAADLQSESLANTADALALVPGLFAQSVDGGEGTRLSIRGSGITKGGFTWGNGVQILFDGLPLSSPLGTPYESFEPNAYSAIEVYRGANAFEYGATQLGGAINFVQHTGYDSAPLFLRAEGGSDGYQREQISSGQVSGPLDYYISATRFATDGYQYGADAFSNRLIANVGDQLSSDLRTRLYFEYADQLQQNINAVTLNQLETNPRLNPGSPNGSRINYGSIFVANKTTYDIGPGSNFEFGIEYKNPPLHNGNEPVRTYWHTSDVAASFKYRRQDTILGGRESDTTVAFIPSKVIPGSGAIVTNDATIKVLGTIKYGGSNTTLLASNDLALEPNLWLLTGMAGIWQTRENQITNPVASGVDPNLDKHYSNATPRIGLRYEVTPSVQIYGNVSRLIEAPQIIGYAASTNGAYTGYTTISSGQTYNSQNLTVQSATSYEIGTRGGTERFKWDIDYYEEQLKHELLTIFAALPSPAAPNGVSFTENASPTVDAGIEGSLDTLIWQGVEHRFSLRQSYTWGQFYFVNQGPEQHILPGLPAQTYKAELDYNHSSGLYAKADLDWEPRYPVDYANSQFAPDYTLLGATIGYNAPKAGWRVFVQGQNLSNRYYASFTSTTGIATASSAVYTPGQGRIISAGATYAIK